MSRAQVYSEFQPLEEVIVGRAYNPEDVAHFTDLDLKEMLQKIFYETEEDILKFIDFLKSQNVTVRRPDNHFHLHHPKDINGKNLPHFQLQKFSFSYPNQPLMPRDTAGIYGNSILEFYTGTIGRYFDNWSTHQIFLDYFKAGANWVSMPPPCFDSEQKDYTELQGKELLFHAANILKCGKDLFYSQVKPQYSQGKGTDLGIEWFQRVLGNQFRYHPVNCGGHLDGKLAFLKPGVLACWNPSIIPDALKKWNVIQIPDTFGHLPEEFRNIRKRRFYKDFVERYLKEWIGYCDESVFDVNMFSINEQLVVTNGYNKEIYDQFKKNGIEAWPFHFRHQHFWDGAIHCLTLDTRRKGDQEDYLE